jgi:hypothetical protein
MLVMRSLFALVLLCCSATIHAELSEPATTEIWPAERCTQLQQSKAADPASPQQQQQLQQHCPPPGAAPSAAIMPVRLDLQAPFTPQRVQHNSTLEWLGSSMLLVLLGFWLWIGRK